MMKALRGEKSRFDVIHLHNFRTYQNIMAARYARESGVPYVIQAYGSLARVVAKQGLKRLYDSLWGYRLLREAAVSSPANR
jgi:hypothetical protein